MGKNTKGNGRFFLKLITAVIVLCAVCTLGFLTGMDKKISNFFLKDSSLHESKRSSNVPTIPPPDPLEFEHAAVAADHKLCSKVGRDILKKGGHAVDAAIATALCVGVINPHSAGLGGGGFMIIYDRKSKRSSAIDFREMAPGRLTSKGTEEMLHVLHLMKLREQSTMKPSEGLLVGVPGELRGFEKAWKRFGKLKWKDLFQPAADICKKGYKVHPSLATAIAKNALNITTSEGLSEIFTHNGRVLAEGDVIKRPVYGKTLEMIGKSGGADILYNGKFSKDIVNEINSEGGIFTLDDLKKYEAIEREPLKADIGHMDGAKLLSVPPPAGGGAVMSQALQILSGFNFTKKDMEENPGLTYHRIIEAFKFAHASLTFLGDPKFVGDTTKTVQKMLDSKQSKRLRDMIDGKTHPVRYYGPINYQLDVTSGTTHLSIVDEEGNGVSLTSSINKYFGSKIRSKKYGIIFNDQLADAMNHWVNEFGLVPDSFKAHRKPLSLSCPAILLDKNDDLQMVIGAAGGRYIPTTLAQVFMNYYWFGDSLKDAVAKPRLHSQLFPEMVLVEENFPNKLVNDIRKYGHRYVTNDTALFTGTPGQIMGVVQVIARKKNGELLALADYRKGGIAAGYKK
ncbi:glutathione hydrolase 1 proenzyme-like [Actinia tenebrosa]|uniref:Glutathione hydrolase 1 proenzyme-like n=1 Tax=Actinia tenebrosa TaxID=6105 RepID=A0A6P8HK22_ACTTE|nr:glutathione hydrolase 1 proenzyme-like [Actinia tenebrosa]